MGLLNCINEMSDNLNLLLLENAGFSFAVLHIISSKIFNSVRPKSYSFDS